MIALKNLYGFKISLMICYSPSEFIAAEGNNFIKLPCNNILRMKFNDIKLTEFQISVKDGYPILNSKAENFYSIYNLLFRKLDFCQLQYKYQVRINLEKEIRMAVSTNTPRSEKSYNDQQVHPSNSCWNNEPRQWSSFIQFG